MRASLSLRSKELPGESLAFSRLFFSRVGAPLPQSLKLPEPRQRALPLPGSGTLRSRGCRFFSFLPRCRDGEREDEPSEVPLAVLRLRQRAQALSPCTEPQGRGTARSVTAPAALASRRASLRDGLCNAAVSARRAGSRMWFGERCFGQENPVIPTVTRR